MKKKNILFIILGFVLFFIVFTFAYFIYNNSNSQVNSMYSKYSNDVDSGISEFMETTYFKSLSDSNKVRTMKKLLVKYTLSGQIKNVYYNEDNMMYSFQYKDGILGGVMLKDFDPYMN